MVNSVYEIFVEQITVLVLLHTGVEQAGPVLQTELTNLTISQHSKASTTANTTLPLAG